MPILPVRVKKGMTDAQLGQIPLHTAGVEALVDTVDVPTSNADRWTVAMLLGPASTSRPDHR
jgi:hypothetical protein